MNRKLLLLDVVLVAVLVFAGVQIRKEIQAAKAREKAMLNRPLRNAPPPPFTPLPAQPPVMPSGYANIAEKMLFDRSRNPVVVVETPPPPPPKPVPPLPVYHGVLSLGGRPVAILSVNQAAAHKGVRPGEQIGPFKLLDINSEEMSLEWEGQVIHKKLDELVDLAAANSQAQPEAAARTETAPAPQAPPPAVKSGPGELTQWNTKTCSVNDGNAEGAVVDGYKKIMHATPFGKSCTWDPVGK